MEESIFERPLEDQLCFEVYRAASDFGKMYNRALKEFHLTFPQYLVIPPTTTFRLLLHRDMYSRRRSKHARPRHCLLTS